MNPNIILLVIDSFRSDKFFHSTTTSKKPNIDNLIKNGTYFSQAISPADATILSWSALYTGKFPFKTGIRSARFNKLDKNISTMFDIFEAWVTDEIQLTGEETGILFKYLREIDLL